MVCRTDGPWLAPWVGFFLITWPGIDRTSYLALFSCLFLSVGCMHLPHVQYTMPASKYKAQSGHLYLRRGLVMFEDVRIAHIGDQLLRLFTERIELFSSVQILCWRVPVRVILELLTQFFDGCLAIRILFLDGWVRYTWNSVINDIVTGFPVKTSQTFSGILTTCVLEKWATGFPVRDALFAMMVTSILRIWRTTRGNLGDWCTLQYKSSPVFMYTTFSIHIAGSVLKRAIWSSLIKLQSFSLSELQIAPIYCILVSSPRTFVHRDSGFVQIVLGFFQVLIVIHRAHCCEEHWLPILFEGSSSWDQSTFNDGVQFISVPDVADVLGEVIRQQYIVLQCRINESTSWMSLNCSQMQEMFGRVRVQAALKPFLWSSSLSKASTVHCEVPSNFIWIFFNQVVNSYCSIIFSRNGFIMSQQSDHEFWHFRTTLTVCCRNDVCPFSSTNRKRNRRRQCYSKLWSWFSLRSRFPCTDMLDVVNWNFFWRFCHVCVDSIHDAKYRFDHNINTVTSFMTADLHIQDRADYRFSTDVSSLRDGVCSRRGVFVSSGLSSWSVMKNCPLPIFFEKPALEQSLVNFWSSGSSANFCSYSRNRFPCTDTSVWEIVQALGNSVGTTIDSQFSFSAGSLTLGESLAYSLHKFWVSCLTETTVRRINSTVSSLPLNWIDFFPFPLLFNSPLSTALVARNTGCPLSAKLSIMPSAVLSHSPSGLWGWVPYHFFSDPGPRNDRRPCGNLRAYSVILRTFAIQFSLFPRFTNQCHCTLIWRWSVLSGSHFDSVIIFWISSRNPNDPIQVFELLSYALSDLVLVPPKHSTVSEKTQVLAVANWTALSVSTVVSPNRLLPVNRGQIGSRIKVWILGELHPGPNRKFFFYFLVQVVISLAGKLISWQSTGGVDWNTCRTPRFLMHSHCTALRTDVTDTRGSSHQGLCLAKHSSFISARRVPALTHFTPSTCTPSSPVLVPRSLIHCVDPLPPQGGASARTTTSYRKWSLFGLGRSFEYRAQERQRGSLGHDVGWSFSFMHEEPVNTTWETLHRMQLEKSDERKFVMQVFKQETTFQDSFMNMSGLTVQKYVFGAEDKGFSFQSQNVKGFDITLEISLYHSSCIRWCHSPN